MAKRLIDLYAHDLETRFAASSKGLRNRGQVAKRLWVRGVTHWWVESDCFEVAPIKKCALSNRHALFLCNTFFLIVPSLRSSPSPGTSLGLLISAGLCVESPNERISFQLRGFRATCSDMAG
jgi:hypothetical protein